MGPASESVRPNPGGVTGNVVQDTIGVNEETHAFSHWETIPGLLAIE